MFARCWRRTARRQARWGQCVVPTGCWRRNCINAGLSLKVIENALVLAATRRLIRPSEAPPLGTIRSLAYFLPVIEEVLASHVSPEYFEYLRYKLARTAPLR